MTDQIVMTKDNIVNPKTKSADERKRFIRRRDLDVFTRLTIAFTALIAIAEKQRGTITKLAQEFLISRTFVYMLANSLMEHSQIAFNETCPPALHEKSSSIAHILSLRLDGKCSIEAISRHLKRFEIGNHSPGYISQVLNKVGSSLPNTLSLIDGDTVQVIYASDEIFSKRTPILITVDPVSSAILKIEMLDKRTAEAWINHWESIEDSGCIPLYLVCDEGTALVKAHTDYLSDLIRQPDTYHAIAHVLGVWDKRFEKIACDAIEKEYELKVVLNSELDEIQLSRIINKYEEAKTKAQEKIEIYDSFHYLYTCIVKELDIFDENGKLRDRQNAESNIEVCLDLLESEIELKKPVKRIRRVLGDLLNYFEIAEVILEEILGNVPNIDEKGLSLICLAWQWRKSKIKAKSPERKSYCAKQEAYYIETAKMHIVEDFDDVKDQILKELDEIVQSSSMVECINSIIRPYLNSTKNQITQEALNLIMFYHNHRRYSGGKRKGQIPYELLTEKSQSKDWLDLLMEHFENSH